jgi:hypothetical protein
MRCGFRHKGCSVCDEALLLCDEALANQALCSSCSSFRRKPESNVFTLCWSFPRRRESSSCCFGFLEQELPLAFGERVPFFARAKKGTKETRPSALRPLGIVPNGSAPAAGFR